MGVEPDRDAPAPAVTVESAERKPKGRGKSLKVGAAAAALVLCLGGGLAVGRYFFPQVSATDYSQTVQRCEELEQQQKQTGEELERKTAELEQAEKQNGQLRYRLEHVRSDRDYYHRKLNDMEKKLDTLEATLEEENP